MKEETTAQGSGGDGGEERKRRVGVFHKVQGWLQIHHHFGPWAHVRAVTALLIHHFKQASRGCTPCSG